jgi:hypothetical protein
MWAEVEVGLVVSIVHIHEVRYCHSTGDGRRVVRVDTICVAEHIDVDDDDAFAAIARSRPIMSSHYRI